MRRHVLAAALAAVMILGSASAAFAGEVTGNGKSLHKDGGGLHGHSACAYSGQEDLQFFTKDVDGEAKAEITRGVPGHAQSWGQIPKAVRDGFDPLMHPGNSCNPNGESVEG